MQRCQQPVLAFLGQLKDWAHPLYLSNHSLQPVEIQLTVSDGDSGEILLSGIFRANAGETVQIGRIPAMVSDQKLILLHYECDGQHFGNHFITGTPAYRPEDMLRWFEQIRRLPVPFDYEA